MVLGVAVPPGGKVPSNTAETQTQEIPYACRLSCWLEVDLNNEYLKMSSTPLNEKLYLNVYHSDIVYSKTIQGHCTSKETNQTEVILKLSKSS